MLASLPTSRPRVATLSRPVAFWSVAATTALLLAASSAPSPLYPVFQTRFGFSASTLTVIFAVYVVALLASLLTVGALSDTVGRRPVLAAALVVEAASMAIFLGADGVAWLVAARVVQGLATGAAVGVLGAYLLDLQPADGSRLGSLVNSAAPTSGLGLGALGTGLLVQYAPHPTTLVFAILTAVFVVLALVTTVLLETVEREVFTVAVLRPAVSVPLRARRAFAAAVPTMLATWALGGLVLSVGGSLVSGVFGQRDHAAVGAILGVFAASGALAAVALGGLAPDRMARAGKIALLVGTVAFVGALLVHSLPVFVIALATAGGGFGSAFLGALRSITQLAQSHERAALLSAVYVVSYLGFSVPAVVSGLLIVHIGLHDTAVGYGVLVGLLTVAGLVLESRGDGGAPGQAERACPAGVDPVTGAA